MRSVQCYFGCGDCELQHLFWGALNSAVSSSAPQETTFSNKILWARNSKFQNLETLNSYVKPWIPHEFLIQFLEKLFKDR